MLQSTAMISQRNDVKSNAMAMRERERKSRTGFRPSRVATLCLSITLLRLAASSDPKRHLQIIGNNQMPPWIYLEELLSDWPSQSPSRENSIFPTAVVSLLPSVNDEKTSMMKTSQSASIVSSAPTHIEEATSPPLEMSEMQTITPTTTRQFDADIIASWSPSITPTSTASSSPSDLPTSFPTLQCHDQPLYRSPINNLTCDDHGGTNCVHWRILGLNTTQLAELIEKCPITCRIPCGHFLQYSISLGFSIAKVPGLMDAPTKGRLELVTMQHLLAYIRTKLDRRVAFEFDKVELVSQASVQETPNEHQQVRKAKANVPVYSSSLTIRMEFEGFAIGISQREVTDLLISGIESESYLIALQAADEFFSEAFMSSAIEQPVAPRQNKDSQEGASPAIITISSLFLILAFASGFWCCIHHRRSGTWLPKLNVVSRSYIDEENEFRPQVRFSGMGIRSLSAALRSPRNLFSLANTGRLLSFDDSRASTHHTGNGAPLLRLLASLSLSRSRSSTGMEESTHQTSEQGSPITENSQSAPIESLSPHSDDSEMEHPLSSIIPPMIVIDDIDGDMNLHSKPALNRDSPQVPGKIIKASTSLISALRKERGIGNDGILYFRDSESNPETSWPYPEDARPFSPFGLEMDSDSDDNVDASVASTPILSKRKKEMMPFRRSRSFSALDRAHIHKLDEDTKCNSKSTVGSDAIAAICNKIDKRRSVGLTLTATNLKDGSDSSTENEIDLPPHPMKRTISSVSDERINVVPFEASTPDRGTEVSQTSPLSAGWSNHSRCWSFSPFPKTRNDPISKSSKRAPFPKIVDLSAFKKLQPTSTPWERQSYETDSIGVVTDHSTEARDDKPTRYEFEAPRKGQLGLVIESDAFTGPVVYAVKDYSPLLGLVQQGDKIVQVDEKNTTRCTLTDMSRLLSMKPSMLHGSNTNLRIVVLRSQSREGPHSRSVTPPQAHSRASSYGSTSSFASMSNFGITSSFDETDSHTMNQRPMRNVRFIDDPVQGATLSQHKVRGSF